ncbi:MAG: hypothetical protein K9N46_10345 [Candidatus Marinimicrobia bacterium]|nr:hypothetical protein [Candidatus Neomarinimicrobiota bacterium]MCF7829222.1 hypothetical protein [Candidatus Neomarinimicrobiota bacterium]MCF7881125.1 hypothetical protein [Candidatus Neomarinimicrobiota bacterium]
MEDTENIQILQRYYHTAVVYLLLTATMAAILFGLRIFQVYLPFSLSIATVHLGTLGALTMGIMGLYLRLFYGLEVVEVKPWTVRTIHILPNVGIGILTIGFLLNTWPVLAVGFLGTAYALIWWAVEYFRWLLQADSADRKGALLFGAFGVIGLVVAVLIGGYLFHGYLSGNTVQNMRLTHIHAGFVGWASLGLLGIGIALRGGENPVTKSIGILQGSAWVWFAGFLLLAGFMVTWNLSLLMIAGSIIILGLFGYGYSMPKVGELGSDSSEAGTAAGSKRLLPYIIIGFLGLFVAILLGFDISINYPSGRAGSHRIIGVGGWLVMTFLMALLSEIPRTSLALLQSKGETVTAVQQYLYPGIFRIGWIVLTAGLLIALTGYFTSPTIMFAGLLLLTGMVAILAISVLMKYPVTTGRAS